MDDICKLYRNAAQLMCKDIHVISVDEKTGIQALERLAVTPMKKIRLNAKIANISAMALSA